MPDPNVRPSLETNINEKLSSQHAGGAFDVTKTLEKPNVSVPSGKVIDAVSSKGQQFQNPNGFVTKTQDRQSQLKVVQTDGKQGKSEYALADDADVAGKIINSKSSNAQQFKTQNGFEVKVPTMESRLKVVQTSGRDGISKYVKNIDTRKYSTRSM